MTNQYQKEIILIGPKKMELSVKMRFLRRSYGSLLQYISLTIHYDECAVDAHSYTWNFVATRNCDA